MTPSQFVSYQIGCFPNPDSPRQKEIEFMVLLFELTLHKSLYKEAYKVQHLPIEKIETRLKQIVSNLKKLYQLATDIKLERRELLRKVVDANVKAWENPII